MTQTDFDKVHKLIRECRAASRNPNNAQAIQEMILQTFEIFLKDLVPAAPTPAPRVASNGEKATSA